MKKNLERANDYDPARPARPWLYVFAYRQASDYRRLARHRREVLADADEPASPLDGADDQHAARDRRALVEEALHEVELDRRAVLLLHDLQDTPMTDVAAMLQIPLQTAYSRLRVAREELIKAAKRIRRERGET